MTAERRPDPAARFDRRSDDYRAHRPGYPRQLFEALARDWGLGPDSRVADVACGTGLSTRPLLEAGATVVGVEPNAEMRRACREELAGEPRLRIVDGRAEATGLPDGGLDGVLIAQAFHWLDVEATLTEMRRILRPSGWLAVVWNHRLEDASPFLRDYEAFLEEHGVDYPRVRDRWRVHQRVPELLAPETRRIYRSPYAQRLDAAGLAGRFFSSSYSPVAGAPGRQAAEAALLELFERHASADGDGTRRVEMLYETVAYVGRPV